MKKFANLDRLQGKYKKESQRFLNKYLSHNSYHMNNFHFKFEILRMKFNENG